MRTLAVTRIRVTWPDENFCCHPNTGDTAVNVLNDRSPVRIADSVEYKIHATKTTPFNIKATDCQLINIYNLFPKYVKYLLTIESLE